MSDELAKKDEGAQAAHAPAPEATGEILSAGDYEARLEAAGRGSAKKTLDWLSKMMPKGVSEGVKLPALSLLDPTKAAAYKNFHEKAEFSESRKLLKQRLSAWVKAIEAAEDLDDVHEQATERVDALGELLDKNLAGAFETIRPLEKNYRALNGFFLNAQVEPGAPVDAYFYNATTEQLLDTDDPTLFNDLAEKIREEYKFFSLKNVYSNMVIPGWPGGVPQIDRLGKLGEMYKMQVYVDTEDYESYDEVLDNMDLYEGLRASVSEKQYVVLAGNHLMRRAALVVGIDMKEQETVFAPFSRLTYATEREIGGTGIGLALSKYLVEQMNGRIGFDHAPQQGTIFWIRLQQGKAIKPEPSQEISHPSVTIVR